MEDMNRTNICCHLHRSSGRAGGGGGKAVWAGVWGWGGGLESRKTSLSLLRWLFRKTIIAGL